MRRFFYIFSVVLLCLTAIDAFGRDAVVFVPDYVNAGTGSEFTVMIMLNDLPGIKGYSMEIAFNTDVLSVREILSGDVAAEPFYFVSFIDSVAGIVKVDMAVLGAGRSCDASGRLFSVRFFVKAEGADTVRLLRADVRDNYMKHIDIGSGYLLINAGETIQTDIPDNNHTACGILQNFPNPFNNETVLTFNLFDISVVSIRLFDSAGREVRVILKHRIYDIGRHSIMISGGGLSSGVYYYHFTARSAQNGGKIVRTGKIILLR